MELNAKDNENYFGYYIFVMVSAVIGFFTLFGITTSLVTISADKGILNLTASKYFVSVIASAIGTALFILISLLFKKFLKKVFLSEIFLYLYVGFLTSAVNIISFNGFLNIFSKNVGAEGLGWKIAELLAFVVAVIFAFALNKFLVFKSMVMTPIILLKELGIFTAGRLVTEGINFLIMWIMIDKNNMNKLFTKILASVIVIIINYVLSKFVIFRKKTNEQVK